MMSRPSRVVVSVCLMIVGILFIGPLLAATPVATRAQKRVLIIGMDGTRPDALLKADTPTFDELIRTGAFTDTAQILGTRYQKNNTISGPGWSSILTGVWADKHGVNNNEFTGKNFELFPHFFKRVKLLQPDSQTVSLVSWGPIHEHILSEADIAVVEPLRRLQNQTADLRVSASKFNINTRDGNWHHLLAIRQKEELKLYLDGKQIGSIKGVNQNFTLEEKYFFLGRDSRSGKTCLHGQLDDVRLWRRALSEQEIEQSAHRNLGDKKPIDRTGLVSEYLFEDTVVDSLSSVAETAGFSGGPFPAEVISKSQSLKFTKADSEEGSQAIELPSGGGKEHGLRIALTPPLRALPQAEFTVEARFRTTDEGRNILLGNFNGQAGALNLELHENNSVRVYVQPPHPQAAASLKLEGERDKVMAENAARILREEDPKAMFIYFHETDATGHAIGFSPEVPEYLSAIENVDRCVKTVLNSLRARPNYQKEDWLTIVCTDHGGIRRTHSDGQMIPEIRTVFLILHGPAVQPGPVKEQAYLVDVAATALGHLIGSVDKKWQLDGKPVGLKAEK